MKRLFALIAVLLFVAGIGIGHWLIPNDDGILASAATQVNEPDPQDVDTNDYPRTWDLIKEHYVSPDVKDADLFYGSVKGLVESLHDPYSEYLEPAAAELADTHMTGAFFGIGLEIGDREGAHVVLSPIANSPAERAGLRAGDIILEVNGEDVTELSLNDVVTRIRGDKGTKVKLTVFRKGPDEKMAFEVVRDEIKTVSVKWHTVARGKKTFMVITMRGFYKDTDELFAQAAAEAKEAKVHGIVVDLRNNPGGLLDTAIAVACNWVVQAPVTFMEERGKERRGFGCGSNAALAKMPTVVLVNKYSASASEILAGALQDHQKARVIGEKTFGKGCGQSVFEYPDGSSLRLTTFLWMTPLGNSINKKGITPDETLAADPEDIIAGKDVQLDRGLKYLLERR